MKYILFYIICGMASLPEIFREKQYHTLLAVLALQLFVITSCHKANEETIEIKDEGASITDITFKKYCYDNFDINKDGIIDADEAGTVDYINIQNNLGVVTVQGIEIFVNLREFYASQCSNLKDANLYYNTKLANTSFANCTGLVSVTLPDSIKEINFYNCIGLTTINLTNNISAIRENAFAFCTGLSTLFIPKSVKSIGKFAFKSCMNLTAISIPEGVQTIGEQAFYNCTGLSSITVPGTITSIGDFVCVNCTGLRRFSCKAITPPTLGAGAFMGCIELGSISVPQGSVANYLVYDKK